MSSSSASTSASISTTNKDPQQSGYYGSYYSLTFEVKFKCKEALYLITVIYQMKWTQSILLTVTPTLTVTSVI